MIEYEFSDKWKSWVPIVYHQIRNDFDVSRLNVKNAQEVYQKINNIPRLPYLELGYNKRVLVLMENGYGDDIWFYRYFLELKDKINFTAFIPDKIKPLYNEIDTITELPEYLSDYDYWMWSFDFLMLYPKVFRTGKYLSAEPIQLPLSKKSKVGFALGNSDTIEQMKGRAISNKLISYFLEVNAYNFSNVCTSECYNVFKELKDFKDTAQYIEAMDYIICSDNCILHLAGALGKKAIAIFNEEYEWNWDALPDSVLWYDSVDFIITNTSENLEQLSQRIKEKL